MLDIVIAGLTDMLLLLSTVKVILDCSTDGAAVDVMHMNDYMDCMNIIVCSMFYV